MVPCGGYPGRTIRPLVCFLVPPVIYHHVIPTNYVELPVDCRARMRGGPVSCLGARWESLGRSSLNHHYRRRGLLP